MFSQMFMYIFCQVYIFLNKYKNDPLTPYGHTGLERHEPKAFFCLLSFQRLWGPEEFDIDTVFDVNAIVSHVLLWVLLI